ncbi:hypothetical protein INT47_013117 [Mucor saturninus]|uniref:RING-type E3 ubiquitin transferase n=1 Tax=Mucor saturninus TaxID=64648 RepID=A0A8H7R3G7_9FUNG|nr:hypothetical protein INT47_013117 [Mucor saturninus]
MEVKTVNKSHRSRKNNHDAKKQVDSSSEDEEELCYICTEPMETYAVAECGHRTCHRCTLRLRALYNTRNCAYCKTEQKIVIFTKEAEKPFDEFSLDETPFSDKKLGIRFETQEMYKEAMNMLEYNCPQKECTESFKNWGELKQHTRKVHSLNLCDLCSRHKKVFPYEQSLYTSPQLTKHHREGDKDFNKNDETGFTGHPECAFCKSRFFGDDELFVHCRDMHEQCFVCVRNGKRQEYYANYESLEEHFKSDHYMCLYPQCLEKKFVVFESSIDLKAHQIKEHGESLSGMQRSMQSDARKLELNFQYDSYRNNQPQRGGGSSSSGNANNNHSNNNTNKSNNGKKKEETTKTNKSPVASGPSTPVLSSNEFPTMNSVKQAVPSVPRTIPGASTRKGKGKALQKPAGFGALSSGPSTSTSTNAQTTSTEPAEVVASHAAFLSKVGEILKSKDKVAQFRSLTGAYRNSTLSGEDYVNQIVKLTNNSVENSSKIFKGVEDLLDIEDKKWELIRTWRNKQTTMSHFPALDVRSKPPPPKASRVLVIKGPKPTNRVVGATGGNTKSKNVWDKVATAATLATTSNSRSSSAGSSPQSSRPSSPSNTFRTPTKTPWSGSSNTANTNTSGKEFPTLKPKAFPSLPVTTPKHQMILNMRRTASGQQINNAWGGASSEESRDEAAEESSSSNTDKKKKGRKNKVLFRVGL